jgi:replication factor A1
MGGLADEETAAMLIAHELGENEIEGIADVDPGMEEVKFLGKVVSIGELRTFERDDDGKGQVLNVEVADETGRIRVALWDEDAAAGAEELAAGDVLRVRGRPQEGYSGVEVSADRVEGDEEAEIDVEVGAAEGIGSLTMGQSDVTVRGRVLDTEPVRTFDRDDGSEGRVANLAIGDETGRVRVTLWDEFADRAGEIDSGESVEVVDGYVRQRDGDLEVHVNQRSSVDVLVEDVEYVPETTDIGGLGHEDIGETVDVAGVIRSADPKREFDRDDGSTGQVRNVRVQDRTGDVRVALWGEKADRDLDPGDEALFADVEIQDGWQDDIEASAGWRSTVTKLGENAELPASVDVAPGSADPDSSSAGSDPGRGGRGAGGDAERTLDAFGGAEATPGATAGSDAGSDDAAPDSAPGSGSEVVEFTGTVVQTGDPVMLDDGSETMTVDTEASVRLGQEVTVRGELADGRLDADEVF